MCVCENKLYTLPCSVNMRFSDAHNAKKDKYKQSEYWFDYINIYTLIFMDFKL